jgi:hypothetical protein
MQALRSRYALPASLVLPHRQIVPEAGEKRAGAAWMGEAVDSWAPPLLGRIDQDYAG